MKIQLFKPLWDTKFVNKDASNVFGNSDVKELFNILKVGGHHVEVLSPCDLINQYKIEKPDLKILVNGQMYLKNDEFDERVLKERKEIRKIFNNKVPQYHFITDLKIKRKNEDFLKDINLIEVSQSHNIGIYGHLDKIFLFKHEVDYKSIVKDKKLIYIGNERSNARTDLVKEYLLKTKIPTYLYGKWKNEEITENKNYKGVLSFNKSQTKLKRFRYGIVISDKDYRDNNFITSRYWEYLLAGVISFVDSSYDKDEILIKQKDFRIVNNYKELLYKINILNGNSILYKNILDKQRAELMTDYYNGTFQLNILNKIFKNEIQKHNKD